jgi:hypothetical protein
MSDINNGWTDVDDALPPAVRDYLAVVLMESDWYMEVVSWDVNNETWTFIGPEDEEYYISHWRELPEPPKMGH